MEIKVQSLNKNWIKIFGRLDTIDSTRLTTFLIKFLSRFYSINELIQKIKENKTIFQTTSIYFEVNGELFLPFNISTFNYLKKKYGLSDINIKRIKRIRFFPILSDNLEKYLKNLNINIDFEIYDFIEKNVLDRLTMSSTVYSIEYSLIRPFLFSIVVDGDIKQKLEEYIKNIEIFSLGRKKSIGFGLCRFEINNDILFNSVKDRLVYDRIEEEGYYYLLNRVLMDKNFLEIVDLEKSYYEIIRIVGYLESSKEKLYSKRIWLFKEGSIFYFRKSELKTYYIERKEDNLKYFLPTRPVLIKLDKK